MIKCYWKARDQRSKSVNSKQSNIHQLQSCHFLWFLYSLCYRISGSTSSFLARQSQRFFQNIIAHYLQEMKKSNYVVWPAPSSKYLKMACGPKSLATHVLDLRMRSIEVIGCKNIAMWLKQSLSKLATWTSVNWNSSWSSLGKEISTNGIFYGVIQLTKIIDQILSSVQGAATVPTTHTDLLIQKPFL